MIKWIAIGVGLLCGCSGAAFTGEGDGGELAQAGATVAAAASAVSASRGGQVALVASGGSAGHGGAVAVGGSPAAAGAASALASAGTGGSSDATTAGAGGSVDDAAGTGGTGGAPPAPECLYGQDRACPDGSVQDCTTDNQWPPCPEPVGGTGGSGGSDATGGAGGAPQGGQVGTPICECSTGDCCDGCRLRASGYHVVVDSVCMLTYYVQTISDRYCDGAGPLSLPKASVDRVNSDCRALFHANAICVDPGGLITAYCQKT